MVSTGAAVAFPFFIVAKVMRVPTVYIEVYDRLDSPTLTGRLCRPITDLFCVQWEEQTRFYPRRAGHREPSLSPLVFVSVGTDHHPFDRLIGWVDAWLPDDVPVRRAARHLGAAAPRPRASPSSTTAR